MWGGSCLNRACSVSRGTFHHSECPVSEPRDLVCPALIVSAAPINHFLSLSCSLALCSLPRPVLPLPSCVCRFSLLFPHALVHTVIRTVELQVRGIRSPGTLWALPFSSLTPAHFWSYIQVYNKRVVKLILNPASFEILSMYSMHTSCYIFKIKL